jgi:hypothetical protein
LSEDARDELEARSSLIEKLGLTALTEGARAASPEGAPPFDGTVKYAPNGDELTLYTDEPAKGYLSFSAHQLSDGIYPTVHAHFEDPEFDVAGYRNDWEAWMDQVFPGGRA